MKKVLKVIGIILGVIVLAIAVFFVVLQIKTHKALNDPRLADNYYESIPTGGELEKKYLGNGGFAVEHTPSSLIINPSRTFTFTIPPS